MAVFNKIKSFCTWRFYISFHEAGGVGGKNKSIYLYLCLHSSNDSHLVFSPLFPAGELEKQQGTKAPLLKTNGAQLELRSNQGSPAGVCSSPLRLKPGQTGCSYLNETEIVVINVCPGNQDEKHNAVEVSAQS